MEPADLKENQKGPALARAQDDGKGNGPGVDLFSREVALSVSLALRRFTTVFGMGTGGTTSLATPRPPRV